MNEATDDIFLRAARVLSSLDIETVFSQLTGTVTELLECDVGLLGRCVSVDGVASIETLALCANGKLLDNSIYPIAGTPCETVVGGGFQFYPNQVGFLFPEVTEINERIESYAAYPLFDRHGATLGLLAVMRFAPLEDRARTETLLRIFAERAVAELERDAAANALRTSEEQYRAIFNASLDALVLFRPDGTIVDVNLAVERLYQFAREELCGRNVLDALARERREAGAAFIREVLEQGYAQTTDGAMRKDGTTFDIEARGVLMEYQQQTHILATVRDISDILARDEALSQSESLLRATVDAGLDCIIVMDEAGRVREFNPAAERCFEYAREDVIGLPLSESIIPERFRAQHEQGLTHYLETGEGPFLGRRVEVTAMRKGGGEFPVELTTGVAQTPSGNLFIGYLRDITERHRADRERQALEAQLRQAQKMEALGHLTGGIAHDFNNILTSVLGYVEMAGERAAGGHDEKLDRYLLRARLSAERARDLVQQMLTFSRGQQGEPRSLRLQSAVEEGMYLLESTLPATLHLKTSYQAGLPTVLIDPVHIEQVLVNLCINARDAMDGMGNIEVALRAPPAAEYICSSCHQACTGDFVELAVIDDGPGLGKALIERIFEPFFSTKDAGKGSGMGLSSVHGIVHEYGGHIIVESTPGAGAAFRVLLPAEQRATGIENHVNVNEHRADSDTLRGRVLVVDDNLVVAEFLDELLSNWGLTVVPYTNSSGAWEYFRSAPQDVDVVITDQTMPQITGLELARKMLALRADLPVILYTGYSESVTEQSVHAAGIKALVRKPLDITRFKSVLAGVLTTRA